MMRLTQACTFTALFAHLAYGSATLTTQPDACLDGSAPANCSGALSGTLTNGADNLTFNDVATAGFGILHVATNSSFTVNNNQAWSYGYVGFTDDLTINSATMQGQTGTLNLSYYIDGLVSSSGQSSAFLQVVTRVYAPTLQNYVADFNQSPLLPVTVYNETVTLPTFTFTYGQQFELYFSMIAINGTVNDNGSAGYTDVARTGSGSGYANFANTLVLTGLHTNDPNATFVSGSGMSYSQDGVVPEPATLVLCGVPLVLIGLAGSRRRARETRAAKNKQRDSMEGRS